MSHFIVLVVSKDVEYQLAPYNECEDAVLEKNAHWDWWVIGGRWKDFLVTTEGLRTNQALKKDIDIDKTYKDWEFKSPFAFVHRRKWYAKAKMWWWGLTHDEDKNWDKKFKKLWKKVKDDELITVVDCHI